MVVWRLFRLLSAAVCGGVTTASPPWRGARLEMGITLVQIVSYPRGGDCLLLRNCALYRGDKTNIKNTTASALQHVFSETRFTPLRYIYIFCLLFGELVGRCAFVRERKYLPGDTHGKRFCGNPLDDLSLGSVRRGDESILRPTNHSGGRKKTV